MKRLLAVAALTAATFPIIAAPVTFQTSTSDKNNPIVKDGDGGVYIKHGTWQHSFQAEFPFYPKDGEEMTIRFLKTGEQAGYLQWNDGAVQLTSGKDVFLRLRIKNNEGKTDTRDLRISPFKPVQRKFFWDEFQSGAVDVYNHFDCGTPEEYGNVVTIKIVPRGEYADLYWNNEFLAPVPLSSSPFKMRIPPRLKLLGAEINNTASAYEPVNLKLRNNAKISNGASLPGKVESAGIPFQMNSGKYDSLDAGKSYYFQGFGHDWNDLRSSWLPGTILNPMRLRFRVPFRQYKTLHVLAASDETRKNAIDTFTIQFYRPSEYSGFPKNFKSVSVPGFAQPGSMKFVGADGKEKYLHHIEVPLDIAALSEFRDQNFLDFEITKDVHVWRAYSDPFFGSVHGGGLPSSVHLFAATLEAAPVSMNFKSDYFGSLFLEGEKVRFTGVLHNETNDPQTVKIAFEYRSFSPGCEGKNHAEISLAPLETKNVPFEFMPERFGHYDLKWTASTNGKNVVFSHAASYLRKREPMAKTFDEPGFQFGFWPFTSHNWLSRTEELEFAGRFGLSSISCAHNANDYPDDAKAIMRKYGIRTYSAGCFGWFPVDKAPDGSPMLGPKGLEAMKKLEINIAKAKEQGSTDVNDPQFYCVMIEPGGVGAQGTPGIFYNEPYIMTDSEKNNYTFAKFMIREISKRVRAAFPNVHMLMPWGDPVYPVPFLMDSPDVMKDFVGTAYDAPVFGRLPEAQVSQNSTPHRAFMFADTWKKYKKTVPENITVEGPFISPVCDAYLDEYTYAGHLVRTALILAAHGFRRQYSAVTIADGVSWWGEEQYGGNGLLGRKSTLAPHIAASTFGALVNRLRYMEYDGADETGSMSLYSLRFKDVRDGKILRILWTLRGKRSLSLEGSPTGKITLFDAMDNEIPFEKNTLSLTGMPVYLYGFGKNVKLTAGAPDHSDAKTGQFTADLGNAAELLRTTPANDPRHLSDDKNYTDVFQAVVRRFPAKMSAKTIPAPAEFGGKALAVDFDGAPEKDRMLMPYYSKFYADKVLPGVPEKLSVWVKAHSDWGRIVFVLADAKGEEWINVGAKDSWNCDDQFAQSYFIHDSWRLLRIDLPGSLPYDVFRTQGTSWWGSRFGDGIVDYPLTLKKVFVERRTKALHADALIDVPANGPVELGQMIVEYHSKADMTQDAIALSKVRMELPGSAMSNPYIELTKSGTLPAPGKIERIAHPADGKQYDLDGTRGEFFFPAVADATGYDVYVSFYADGRGAMKLGTLKAPGGRVNGFKANTDLYAFYVYRNAKKETSKPSELFKFHLEDLFSQK